MSLHAAEPRLLLREPVRPRALDLRRWTVLSLAVGGAGLFLLSWCLPWWSFRLVAPQYPQGLELSIALSGVTGDVHEIDILNHYIGMRSMSDAAALERSLSLWLVAATALAVTAGVLVAGRRLGWLLIVPAAALPLGFLADLAWWMWRFGHELDPAAPLAFEPFMPALVGAGEIGQFRTTAAPDVGFWVALVATGLVVGALLLRKRVCDACPVNGTCGATCRHLLVLRAP